MRPCRFLTPRDAFDPVEEVGALMDGGPPDGAPPPTASGEGPYVGIAPELWERMIRSPESGTMPKPSGGPVDRESWAKDTAGVHTPKRNAKRKESNSGHARPAALVGWGCLDARAKLVADASPRWVWRAVSDGWKARPMVEALGGVAPLADGPGPLLAAASRELKALRDAGKVGTSVLVALWGVVAFPTLAPTTPGTAPRIKAAPDWSSLLAFWLLHPDVRAELLQTNQDLSLLESFVKERRATMATALAQRWVKLAVDCVQRTGFWMGGANRGPRDGTRNERSLAGVVLDALFPAKWDVDGLVARWKHDIVRGIGPRGLAAELTRRHRVDATRPRDGRPLEQMVQDAVWAAWATHRPGSTPPTREDLDDIEADLTPLPLGWAGG